MKHIFSENKLFFLLFAVCFAASLLLLFSIKKGDVVLYFSQHRTPFWDVFFIYTTKISESFIYIVSGIIFLFIRFRYTLIMGLIAGVVTLIAAILKNIFQHPRPRPYYEALGYPDNLTFVEGILPHGGMNAFPSGHTFSAFAAFTFLALLSKSNIWQVTCILLAFLVGLSRVYLVHHFWEDVVFGGILGLFVGLGFYYYNAKIPLETDKWYNRKLGK